MAPFAKALAIALSSSSPALAATAAAGGATAEPNGACSARGTGSCLTQPPVLLQTHQALAKPEPAESALVPAYAAPPGARATPPMARAQKGASAQQHKRQRLLSTSASSQALENFRLLKELRQSGFTCPGGQYFPPNNGELEFDCRLWQAAVGHSQDMAARNYFSHVTPEGLDPFDRSEPYGAPTDSENIAAGGATAARTLEMWQNSDGHCTNMMNADYNRMAVGYAYAASTTYKHYWTQLFGTDNGAVYRSCYTGEADPVDDGSDGRAGSCEDSETGCQGWANAGYCQEGNAYQPYMHDNCALSCGLCSSSGEGSGSGSGSRDGSSGDAGGEGDEACVDSQTSCQGWADSGYCAASSQYSGYMQANCRLSCGVCSGGSGSGSGSGGSCQDSNSDCPGWAGLGYCEAGNDFAPYMQANCKSSCGLCR